MSDQTPSAPRNTRPRPPQQDGQRPRRPRPAPPASRESRFIGYLVLGFGVVAVAAVLILAFSQKDAPDAAPAAQSAQIQWKKPVPVTDPSSLAELGIVENPARPVEPPKPKTAPFKRGNEIAADKITGAWQAMIGGYTAVVQMDGKVYQIILASADPNAARIYSSGVYQIREDLLTFTPQPEWPAPTSAAGAAVSYNMLTRASFSFVVIMQGGRMLWQNAPQTETSVYTTPKSPLFQGENTDYVAWQKLNR